MWLTPFYWPAPILALSVLYELSPFTPTFALPGSFSCTRNHFTGILKFQLKGKFLERRGLLPATAQNVTYSCLNMSSNIVPS